LIGPELTAEVRQLKLGKFEIDLTLADLRRPDDEELGLVVASLQHLPRRRITRVKLSLDSVADAVRPQIEAALEGLKVEASR
jgi:hypothetical protein